MKKLIYEKIIYNSFQKSITRAQALLALQEGIEIIFEGKEDFISYLKERYPESATLLDYFSYIKELLLKQIEDTNLKKELEDSFSSFNKKEIEKALKPLLEIYKSVELVYEKPLYYEAVISAVTSFEAYLRDRLVDIISRNKEIEEKFYEELNKGLTYNKTKEYNYEWGKLLGYIVVDGISFFDLNIVDKIYKKALEKEKKSFSIFKSKIQRERLQNFIDLRHLIVHNAGIIDHKFKQKTYCKFKIREQYKLSKKYVKDMIGTMLKVVNNIESVLKIG